MPAIAVGQRDIQWLTQRIRGQARSYKGFVSFRDAAFDLAPTDLLRAAYERHVPPFHDAQPATTFSTTLS